MAFLRRESGGGHRRVTLCWGAACRRPDCFRVPTIGKPALPSGMGCRFQDWHRSLPRKRDPIKGKEQVGGPCADHQRGRAMRIIGSTITRESRLQVPSCDRWQPCLSQISKQKTAQTRWAGPSGISDASEGWDVTCASLNIYSQRIA
jgi:hypothetical protein